MTNTRDKLNAAAILRGRKGAGAEVVPEYVAIARERVQLAGKGMLRTRSMDQPVYEPPPNSSLTRRPWEVSTDVNAMLFDPSLKSNNGLM